VELDDTNGLIRITCSSGKILEINENNISLGSRNSSAHPAAFADILKQKISSLIDTMSSAKINTALGPQPFLPDTLDALSELKNSLDDFISQKVTLD